MQFTALELSRLVDGTIEGDAEVKVDGPAKIEDGREGTVSFIANPKYEPFAYTTQASVLIISDDLELTDEVNATLIRVKDPYDSFSKILDKFGTLGTDVSGTDSMAFVDPSATLGEQAWVGAFSFVGKGTKIGNRVKVYPNVFIGDNVTIGNDCIIFPGCRIYEDCVLGNSAIIHAGVVVGSDGFGFAPQEDGAYKKVAQIGNVIIEDNVEIGSNTVIDRATVGSTVIKSGVKLDNLIQVAHNVEIGENTVIAAQTGISGSTKLGEGCVVGGQVGFVGHLKIAPGTKINAQSGISKSITDKGLAWNGSPAFEYKESLKSQVVFRQLPALLRRIEELEQLVESLTEKKEKSKAE
jgi:UDP-3-O-[3-hydroxymyristoyl] glucosamine N-acyltransferase